MGDKELMTPLLFDRALLRQRRRRAFVQARDDADFLLRHVADEMSLRLSAVNRRFALGLDSSSPTQGLAALLLASGKVDAIVRLDHMLRQAFSQGAGFVVIGDDEMPPFGPARFDLIVSALGLQAMNDVPGALIQMRRMLKPDGLFMAATLGGATLSELRDVFAHSESEITGGISPRISPFIDVREMGALLQRAGFALPVCDAELLTVRYNDVFALFRDLRAMAATNILTARTRTPLSKRLLMRVAELYQQRYAAPDGRISVRFEFIFALGWAPHESQQKPLKPGSAKQRLADVLKGSRDS